MDVILIDDSDDHHYEQSNDNNDNNNNNNSNNNNDNNNNYGDDDLFIIDNFGSPSTSNSRKRPRSTSSLTSNLTSPKCRSRKSCANFKPLAFHAVIGQNVRLSPCQLRVECVDDVNYDQGYIFTSRPLAIHEKITFQITKVNQYASGSFTFGFTSCNPFSLISHHLPSDNDDLLERSEYWVFVKDICDQVNLGDKLSFQVTDDGEVKFWINGCRSENALMFVDASQPLWAFIDLRGRTWGVSIVQLPKKPDIVTSDNVDGDDQSKSENACEKILNCGHQCGGIKYETTCLPCLNGCVNNLRQTGTDMCTICYTDALNEAPVLQLGCGHIFHFHCCQTVLAKRWSGPRITFRFSLCPICKSPIEHEALDSLLQPIRVLYDDVRRKALTRLEFEDLTQCSEITTPGFPYFNDAAGYAMERYAYYVCCKCQKAYYGGQVACHVDAGVDDDNYDPNELVCGACSDVAQGQECRTHGLEFLSFKCRYCCSIAIWFCFGTTHFCSGCHSLYYSFINKTNNKNFPKCPVGPGCVQLEGSECPLRVQHPPTGEEFALGCGMCLNAFEF